MNYISHIIIYLLIYKYIMSIEDDLLTGCIQLDTLKVFDALNNKYVPQKKHILAIIDEHGEYIHASNVNIGSIYIDNVNINDINTNYLRKNILYVNQNSKLFDKKIYGSVILYINNT